MGQLLLLLARLIFVYAIDHRSSSEEVRDWLVDHEFDWKPLVEYNGLQLMNLSPVSLNQHLGMRAGTRLYDALHPLLDVKAHKATCDPASQCAEGLECKGQLCQLVESGKCLGPVFNGLSPNWDIYRGSVGDCCSTQGNIRCGAGMSCVSLGGQQAGVCLEIAVVGGECGDGKACPPSASCFALACTPITVLTASVGSCIRERTPGAAGSEGRCCGRGQNCLSSDECTGIVRGKRPGVCERTKPPTAAPTTRAPTPPLVPIENGMACDTRRRERCRKGDWCLDSRCQVSQSDGLCLQPEQCCNPTRGLNCSADLSCVDANQRHVLVVPFELHSILPLHGTCKSVGGLGERCSQERSCEGHFRCYDEQCNESTEGICLKPEYDYLGPGNCVDDRGLFPGRFVLPTLVTGKECQVFCDELGPDCAGYQIRCPSNYEGDTLCACHYFARERDRLEGFVWASGTSSLADDFARERLPVLAASMPQHMPTELFMCFRRVPDAFQCCGEARSCRGGSTCTSAHADGPGWCSLPTYDLKPCPQSSFRTQGMTLPLQPNIAACVLDTGTCLPVPLFVAEQQCAAMGARICTDQQLMKGLLPIPCPAEIWSSTDCSRGNDLPGRRVVDARIGTATSLSATCVDAEAGRFTAVCCANERPDDVSPLTCEALGWSRKPAQGFICSRQLSGPDSSGGSDEQVRPTETETDVTTGEGGEWQNGSSLALVATWGDALAMCSAEGARLCTSQDLLMGLGLSFDRTSMDHNESTGRGTWCASACTPPVGGEGAVSFLPCRAPNQTDCLVCSPLSDEHKVVCCADAARVRSSPCGTNPCSTDQSPQNLCMSDYKGGFSCVCDVHGKGSRGLWNPSPGSQSCLRVACTPTACNATQDSGNRCVDHWDGTFSCDCGEGWMRFPSPPTVQAPRQQAETSPAQGTRREAAESDGGDENNDDYNDDDDERGETCVRIPMRQRLREDEVSVVFVGYAGWSSSTGLGTWQAESMMRQACSTEYPGSFPAHTQHVSETSGVRAKDLPLDNGSGFPVALLCHAGSKGGLCSPAGPTSLCVVPTLYPPLAPAFLPCPKDPIVDLAYLQLEHPTYFQYYSAFYPEVRSLVPVYTPGRIIGPAQPVGPPRSVTVQPVLIGPALPPKASPPTALRGSFPLENTQARNSARLQAQMRTQAQTRVLAQQQQLQLQQVMPRLMPQYPVAAGGRGRPGSRTPLPGPAAFARRLPSRPLPMLVPRPAARLRVPAGRVRRREAVEGVESDVIGLLGGEDLRERSPDVTLTFDAQVQAADQLQALYVSQMAHAQAQRHPLPSPTFPAFPMLSPNNIIAPVSSTAWLPSATASWSAFPLSEPTSSLSDVPQFGSAVPQRPSSSSSARITAAPPLEIKTAFGDKASAGLDAQLSRAEKFRQESIVKEYLLERAAGNDLYPVVGVAGDSCALVAPTKPCRPGLLCVGSICQAPTPPPTPWPSSPTSAPTLRTLPSQATAHPPNSSSTNNQTREAVSPPLSFPSFRPYSPLNHPYTTGTWIPARETQQGCGSARAPAPGRLMSLWPNDANGLYSSCQATPAPERSPQRYSAVCVVPAPIQS